MSTSQNGYTVLDTNRTSGSYPRLRKWIVPDTKTYVYLRDGSCGFILTWIAAWWDDNIRPIDLGIFDDWGWAVRPVRGQTSGFSNHASGTAIDVDATRHPRGVPVNRNLTPAQVDKIHELLRYLDGVIRWGGDYSSTVDAMHFELNKPLGDAERLALKLAETVRGQEILEANPGAWAVISSGTPAQGKPQPGTEPPVPKPDPKPAPKPDPKPQPKPEPAEPVVPVDVFTAAILPGRWDAPLDAWLSRHREARDKGAAIVTMTEATNAKKAGQIQQALGHLAFNSYHDPTPGPANILHSWDADRFEAVGLPWKVKLTDVPIFSARGFDQPDYYSVGIALRDKVNGGVILLVGAHLPLENTERRRKAKEEAIATLDAQAFDEGRAQFPDAARMFACDWNRRAHKPTVRDWFKQTWPGMVAAWATRKARTQGPDWIAVGKRLVLVDAEVLPRVKGDPLDHTTKVSRIGWRP